jgi:putative redox protein
MPVFPNLFDLPQCDMGRCWQATHDIEIEPMSGNTVIVSETGNGPYAERVTVGAHVIDADEPLSLGGGDSGISPYEFLMSGLGACTAMTLRMYATRNHWPVDKIIVEVTHEKVASPDGKKIDRFDRVIHLTGALTEEQKARLMAISENCPVSQTLERPSLILSRLAPRESGETNEGHAAEKIAV